MACVYKLHKTEDIKASSLSPKPTGLCEVWAKLLQVIDSFIVCVVQLGFFLCQVQVRIRFKVHFVGMEGGRNTWSVYSGVVTYFVNMLYKLNSVLSSFILYLVLLFKQNLGVIWPFPRVGKALSPRSLYVYTNQQIKFLFTKSLTFMM